MCCVFIFLFRITVTFNINNSIPPTFDGEEEPSQGQKAEEQEVIL